MYADEIKKILSKNLSLQEIYVFVDQDHYKIIVVDQIFVDKSKLEQHKMVYAPITKYIVDNKIHSISIYSFNPQEWKICRKYYIK
ncbi:BolA-like protein; transcription regulator activity [Candidatus Blochmanniella floridana]|uniref:BolA-like protein transcription regulator activity n=1 Tax=Blochmanniella floridana TaxID=203907 RepID=Q7VQS1_BLOFL|nr:BolA-like protein; transcription regulator activity [Candidatus Blochmannia floridanus]